MNKKHLAAVAAFALSATGLPATTFHVVERYSGNVVEINGGTGTTRVVASGLGEMIGIAVDKRGRVFVSRFRFGSGDTVAQVEPINGMFVDVARAAGAFGISVDPESGALYVGGYGSGLLHLVEEITPGVWTARTIATFPSSAGTVGHALRVESRLYVTCSDSGLWCKDVDGGEFRLLVELPDGPRIIAREAGGDLVIGSEGSTVWRVNPMTGQVVATFTGFQWPCGVAVEPSDNSVIVSQQGKGQITRLDLVTGQRTTLASGLASPWQIAPLRSLPAPFFCRVECAGGIPHKVVWPTRLGHEYDLLCSPDLVTWSRAGDYPRVGGGGLMEHLFTPVACGFFRVEERESPGNTGEFGQIPGGSFLMGNALAASGDGSADELPVHEVQVGAFYLGRQEVTKGLWDEVRLWAARNGYTDMSSGGGKGATHPVHSVNWHGVVRWCNARSEMEGLTPCYRVAGVVCRTGTAVPTCDWGANGYRLPTETEWERAARGGATGTRFPWGDTITHGDANYIASPALAYDRSPTTGNHPAYSTGAFPYTAPAGSFAANGFGVREMTGNVMEWCWDWRSGNYYGNSPAVDPRGPASGTQRVYRGGSWNHGAALGRVAARGDTSVAPGTFANWLGFRLARKAQP